MKFCEKFVQISATEASNMTHNCFGFLVGPTLQKQSHAISVTILGGTYQRSAFLLSVDKLKQQKSNEKKGNFN